MSDPPRIVDSMIPELARVLQSAEADVPPAAERSKRRIRAAVAASSALSTATSPPAPQKAWQKAGWLGAVTVVVGATVAVLGGYTLSSAPARQGNAHVDPASNAVASAATVSSPTSPVDPSSPVPSLRVDDLPAAASAEPAITRTSRTVRSVNREGSTEEELALLDAAREALASNQPALTLARLQRYRATFANPHFGTEAEALDIQALAALGRREEARKKAERFLAAHPDSPYTQRVRSAVFASEHD